MIISFFHNDKELNFNRSSTISLGGQPIFNADSMTLLVGPNGAGKTESLLALVKHVTDGIASDDTVLVYEDDYDYRETHVVYYTPVPFIINMPSSDDRRTIIFPSAPKKNASVTDIQTRIASDLKKEFGIDPASTLKLNTITARDIERLIHIVLDREIVEQEWVRSFRDAYTEIKERQLQLSRKLTFEDTPERNKLAKDMADLHKRFMMAYASFAGSEYALKVRAFKAAQRAHKNSSGANLQLVEELGFSITQRYKYLLPTRATKGRRFFKQTLELLRVLSDIVRDPTLEDDMHALDEGQCLKLSSLNIGSVGFTRFNQLSSGAAALIDQFSGITLAAHKISERDADKNLLLLIDEGDAFLHLSWQKRYVDYLDRMIASFKGRFKSIQVIIATHSPVLMSDFPRQFIVNLKDENSLRSYIEEHDEYNNSTFGAPIEIVMREIAETGTIGSFTARTIRLIASKIENGDAIYPEQLWMIGDAVIRKKLLSLLQIREQKKTDHAN